MQAIILAAGMGSRLKQLTADNTKCMVKVNGVTLIERMLRQLERLSPTIDRVILVVGYRAANLRAFVQSLDIQLPIHFVENPVYDKTNNIYSLALTEDYLSEDDSLILESDLIFEDRVLQGLLDDPREDLALVDHFEAWMDGTVLTLKGDDEIAGFVPRKDIRFKDKADYYKTCNIYKFSKAFTIRYYLPYLRAYMQSDGVNQYYEQVLRIISQLDRPILHARRLSGERWYEIDDEQDLDIAESLFAATSAERYALLMRRYGGYWRYPKLLDFCYLVNPYYPKQQLLEEMESNFSDLLRQYPSGMAVNSLLAAKNTFLRPEQIVVGNGAAELIKAYFDLPLEVVCPTSANTKLRTGIIRPSFEEYAERLEGPKRELRVFVPQNFSYSLADLKNFIRDEALNELVLINPDNPSGHYLPYNDILELIDFCRQTGCRLILDESFADFANEAAEKKSTVQRANSCLDAELLEEHPQLVVVKSISKSFGVPGLRLGYLASGDHELIARLKKGVAIWNINSFAEFYLQIAEKYIKDYNEGLALFRSARESLKERLTAIPALTVYPSEANYLLLAYDPSKAKDPSKAPKNAADLAVALFEGGCLIKDLTKKLSRLPGLADRHFLRVAIRDDADNARLASLFENILN